MTTAPAWARDHAGPVHDPTSLAGEAHRRAGRFEIGRSAAGYRFVLKTAAGEIIATSGNYRSRLGARNGIEAVRRNAVGAAVLEPATAAKEAVARPLPEAVLRNALSKSARAFNGLTPERQGTVGVVAGMCIGIALWLFLGTSLLGDNVAAQFVSLFILVGAGGFSGGAAVMLRRNFGEDDGYA